MDHNMQQQDTRGELWPYYLSRALLAALLGGMLLWSGQPWWLALLVGLLIFAGFLWYLHSGWYQVDTSRPYTPLRRDERGREIRNRALLAAVLVGALGYLVLSLGSAVVPVFTNPGGLVLLAAVITYFAVSAWLFSRG